VAAAAERFGGTDLVPTVKGMELASYDPRGAATMALAFATGDRGGCHRRARPVETEAVVDPGWTPDERAAVVANEQDRRAALWCLVGDDFLAESFGPAAAAEWLAALGDERDPEDLRLLGERVWTLTRLFNLREGFGRGDDGLPEALTRGPTGRAKRMKSPTTVSIPTPSKTFSIGTTRTAAGTARGDQRPGCSTDWGSRTFPTRRRRSGRRRRYRTPAAASTDLRRGLLRRDQFDHIAVGELVIGADLPAAPTVGAVEEPLADIRVDVEREVLGRRPTGEDKAVAEDPFSSLLPFAEPGKTAIQSSTSKTAASSAPCTPVPSYGDEFADLIEARLLLAGDITDDIEVALAGV